MGVLAPAIRAFLSEQNAEALGLSAVRRLVGAELASLLGDFMVLPAMFFAVLALGGSGGELAVAFAVQVAAMAAMLPFGGILGDRFQRRRVMVAADLVRSLARGAIAVAFLLGVASFWQLLAAQALHGIATGAFMPASGAIVPDVVPRAIVQPTNALKAVAKSIAGVAGPALGGLALLLGGPGVAMGADAASFLASAALLWGLGPGVRARALGSVREQLREGWEEFRKRRWLRSVTLVFALLNAAVLAPFYVCAPALLERSYGGSGAWAFLLSALAVGGLLAGRLTASWRPGRPLVAATSAFACWGIPLALFAAGAPLLALGAAMVLAGCGEAGFLVLWETTVQRHVEESKLSRLCSFEQFGSLALVPFGFMLGGWLEQTIGAQGALLGAAIFLLLACAGLLCLPCIRQLTAEQEAAEKAESAPPQPLRRPAPLFAAKGRAA